MPILDLHEDDLINAAETAPPVAPRKQDPSFSTWGVVRGAVKAVPAAVAELTGSTADVVGGVSGAFGGVLAATGGSAGGMFTTGTEAERKQTADAAKKLREKGVEFNYRTEAGASFRQVAKDYMPDAQTAHGAEVAVAEFARMATKAVIGGVVAGPLVGALAAGAEEGFTASDKLADQGVDVNTRTQVGLVTGVVTGLGFALPVAGKTVAKTLGLALAGGPASFVAQNAATREILQAADYTQLADQYDPFELWGLGLSFAIPLGFGALAMRGAARKTAPSARPQENGAPAGQPVPEVAPAPPEVVDAARVQLLREVTDSHRATPPEDFAGAQAHETAVTQAMDQLATGQRVTVDNLPDAAGVQVSQALADRMAPVMAEARKVPDLAEFIEAQAIDLEPVAGPAEARGNAFVSWIKSVGGIDFAEKFDIVGERGIRGNYAGIFTKSGQALDTLAESAVQAGYLSRADVDAATDNGGTRALAELIRKATTGERVLTAEQAEAAMITEAQARGAMTAVEQMERELVALGVDPSAARGNPDALAQYLGENRIELVNAKLAELNEATAEASAQTAAAHGLNPEQAQQQHRVALAAELDEAAVERAAIQAVDDADFMQRIQEILSHEPRSKEIVGRQQGTAPDGAVQAGDAAKATRTGPGPDTGTPAAAADTQGVASALQARLDAEIVGNPAALETRLPIAFDDAGNVTDSVTVREFLDTIKAEAEQESADANLLQVAANCFLMNGV